MEQFNSEKLQRSMQKISMQYYLGGFFFGLLIGLMAVPAIGFFERLLS